MASPPPPQPYTADQTTIPLPYAAPLTTNPSSTSPSSSSNSNDISTGILITVLVLAIAVILSASLYLLLRFLRRRHHHPPPSSSLRHHTLHSSPSKKPPNPDLHPLIQSLPLFPFEAVSNNIGGGGGSGGGDCAICLSKFEPSDLLRLLPLCCHAFHSLCIDTWLCSSPSPSCPLCRSPLTLPQSLSSTSSSSSSLSSHSSRSFRVELGNISRRNHNSAADVAARSYSVGAAFDYVVQDDNITEVPVGSFRLQPDFKAAETATNHDDYDHTAAIAAEVGTRGGGWLKEYLSNSISSRSAPFRESGRWLFTGSSRSSSAVEAEVVGNREAELDLEASQLSEEIGELFRWLSGV